MPAHIIFGYMIKGWLPISYTLHMCRYISVYPLHYLFTTKLCIMPNTYEQRLNTYSTILWVYMLVLKLNSLLSLFVRCHSHYLLTVKSFYPRNAQRDRILVKEKRPLQPSIVLVVTSRKIRSSNCWRDLEGTPLAPPALIAASRSCEMRAREAASPSPPHKRSSILQTLTPQPDPERSQRRLESRKGRAPPKAPASSRHCGPVALSTTAGNVLRR
jgi:hypothetical protein